MTNSERAAYIRGLVDGLELDQDSKEVKVINALVELVDDMCLSIEELEDAYDELAGQVDEIDEDLGSLEKDYYDIDEDDDDCSCGCGCHCDDEDDDECMNCDRDCDDCDCQNCESEEDFDDCDFQVTCPTCGDVIELNEAVLDEGCIDCPNCGEKLEFDFDEIIDEDEDEQ